MKKQWWEEEGSEEAMVDVAHGKTKRCRGRHSVMEKVRKIGMMCSL